MSYAYNMLSLKNSIVAVDFDGTVVEHMYPNVGPDVPHAVSMLRVMRDLGNKIILYTMRSDSTLLDAVMWYKERNIELWGINENPEQHSWTGSPKVYANVYIDDAAFGCPIIAFNGKPVVDWVAVGRRLLGVI